ncbi:ATP-dependent RNA helicase SrmB [wastewater metagenome]|uniref:ATP-dependent RNA helicase SrmB n=2 Tax=unclassified sequences TaxID=12908 RepID=A0A5B8REQ5_9ZZZZ|nr:MULTISPECIES: DEAD/DEAH box helicase [Arhodomonas]QEA05982.1 ATP-dependent RNA helicase SrmB [uncultured organism]
MSVDAFERLNPAVQHHVVNSLRWRELRPLQAEAIDPILSGEHALLLAPTAGGKTEAAILPVFSRMLSEHWTGLSVLYLCPIKALLNNLEHRLRMYAALFGRSVGVWHGDIGASTRKKLRRQPPDILLATPESLEVMLDSALMDHRTFFASLRVVVVDEIHAFAGDDRGWHLLAVLGRVGQLTPHVIQRLGLSATVGNAEGLLNWLTKGTTSGSRRVVSPEVAETRAPDVTLDFVGGLDNAALVISRLYLGEKRLVFCDSRQQVEELALRLRELGVTTYVSHSSLSQDERRRAEDAFADGRDCVIVATSTLELGIDVGDLDRMIQIDAPGSVASFLQRIGRTGRRNGQRNCLFLATTRAGFLRAAGLLHRWREGYVEPIVPPPYPVHVLAQQILALVLQEGGLVRSEVQRALQPFLAATEIAPEEYQKLLDHLLSEKVLFEVDGLICLGDEGERRYGRKNFLELFSVFLAAPLMSVMHGRSEVGTVDMASLFPIDAQPIVLTLAGKGWRVIHLDWKQRRVWVEPSDRRGTSRWSGAPPGLSGAVTQGVRAALVEPGINDLLSNRGQDALQEAREEFDWLDMKGSYLIDGIAGVSWWTFLGASANTAIAAALKNQGSSCTADAWRIRFKPPMDATEQSLADCIRSLNADQLTVPIEACERRYKFSDLLPAQLGAKFARERGAKARREEIDWLLPIVRVRVE